MKLIVGDCSDFLIFCPMENLNLKDTSQVVVEWIQVFIYILVIYLRYLLTITLSFQVKIV